MIPHAAAEPDDPPEDTPEDDIELAVADWVDQEITQTAKAAR